MKKKNKDGLELEEYEDYDYVYDNNDEYLASETYDYDFDEVDSDYTKFNTVTDVDVSEDDNVEEYKKEEKETEENEKYDNDNGNGVMSFLSIFSTWFSRIGVAIAIILIAVFIVKGQFENLLLYIMGLIASFFFGYFFMYILVKYGDKE